MFRELPVGIKNCVSNYKHTCQKVPFAEALNQHSVMAVFAGVMTNILTQPYDSS